MTTDELDQLVRLDDPNKLADALAPMDELQRKRLATHAARVYTEFRSERRAGTLVFLLEVSCESLAVLGLCSWTHAKRISIGLMGSGKNAFFAFRILNDRRPEWLEKWVDNELNARFCDWMTVRRLVRAGACPRPSGDAYIARMVTSNAGAHWSDGQQSLVDVLRIDRGLLDGEVWRIFEVDLSREGLFFMDDGEHPMSWLAALVTLAGTGELDRDRLLTASVQALNKPIRPDNASFLLRLHEKLAPALEERVARQSHYIDLLPHDVPIVVAFALGALKELATAERLDVEPFLAAVGPALELRQKGHCKLAIHVLRLAAGQSPGHGGRVACITARGLVHPSPDVQKACVDLIDSLAGSGEDAALADAIQSRIEHVSASQRLRVQSILMRLGERSSAQATTESARAPVQAISREDIDAIPSKWRALAGVDACLAAMNNGGEVPKLTYDSMSVPRLDPDATLMPIATLDELIDRLSAAIENLSDAEELELLLDGMSRFADQARVDFAAMTAPLLKRSEDLLRAGSLPGMALDPQVQVRVLVRAWLQKKPMSTSTGKAAYLGHEVFLTARMAVLSQRLMRRQAGPLLACPTHHGGWLDPRELVKRVRSWQHVMTGNWLETGPLAEARVPDRHDLIQAMLRIAPDHRVEALAQASDIEGEAG